MDFTGTIACSLMLLISGRNSGLTGDWTDRIYMTNSMQIMGLVVWLLVCFIAAGLGAAASINAGSFYVELIRPAWAPPGYLFGPVWTVLYIMMAVAVWLVWRIEGFEAARWACLLFLTQLVLNALWSWLFFAWQLGLWAFLDIVLLWFVLLATMIAFWQFSAMAAALLVPYLLWVSFAGALNYSIWQLNPQVLGG